MNRMIAYCGLACDECSIYLATREDNEKRRVEVAELWSNLYGRKILPEEIYCDGCRSQTGRLFSFCSQCPVRRCALENDLELCIYCTNFPCWRLKSVFKAVPESKTRLENLKQSCVHP
ncbi:MAG: DUF3795 domain-containing protein [Deltaproteobacteria bacterium]|nr:DUF3795 domain-containing protein [Deltaproteobacteria bacterium]MBW2015780.1 DUF3795 domain-containing protein [Deltaproteobacteria bacterium]MBW2128664.1 DUF3795 domain-containing protein [Deltaproteobacteria bacterium]MBW2302643.1 DUF3795 domain-containing protein [Deltaproteobacteria bacterium]